MSTETHENAGVKMLRERLAYLDGEGLDSIASRRADLEGAKTHLENATAWLIEAEREAEEISALLAVLEAGGIA